MKKYSKIKENANGKGDFCKLLLHLQLTKSFIWCAAWKTLCKYNSEK